MPASPAARAGPDDPDRRLPTRALRFDYGDDVAVLWHPTVPELAAAANSISMLMPYVEPFIVRSVRETLPELEEPLQSRTRAFTRQELAHQAQHRRFNDHLVGQCPRLRRLESWIDRAYGRIERKRSVRFRVAFAAGSETIAFGIARWVVRHMDMVFRGVDPEIERLFLWHLAEEVEHKTAAFDAFEATDGSRLRYTVATLLSLMLLIWFVFVGNLVMLRSQRRLRLPVTWFRLARWSISLAWVLLPLVAVSCLPSHNPRDLTDPTYLSQWLRGVDDGA